MKFDGLGVWHPGKQPASQATVEKINEKLLEIEGFLEDDKAGYELVKFLRSNIGFTTKLISGVDLFPFQEIAIKTMFKRDYILGIWSRGLSKSFSTAVFAFLYAIFQPEVKIALISRSFRQSREIFKRIEEIANSPGGTMLAECFNGPVRHLNDEWTMKIGSSEIKALPLGDGEKLRGFRFNCLIVDELLLMPEKVLNEVILPFLSVNANPKKRQDTFDTETEMIKQGLMTEKERTKFPNPKMIGLSSASYQFEHLYKMFEEYMDKIISGVDIDPTTKETKPLVGSYAVLQFAYCVAPTQLYSESLINKAKSEMSPAQFKREFGAQFTDDSSSFFSVKSMDECTVPFGETPLIELKGRAGEKYVIAIDPSWAENEGSDFFVMMVFKLLPNGGYLMVHSYAVAGATLKDHINYFHYLYTHFNPEFIIMDNAGGVQFLGSVNESSKFQNSKIKFLEIKEIDFEDTVDYQGQLKAARKEYNLETRKIVYMQTFNSSWILRANHLLQANINNKRIKFAGDPQGLHDEYKALRNTQIPIKELNIVGTKDNDEITNEEYEIDYELDKGLGDMAQYDAKMIDIIERQQFLIRLTKKQCAVIEPKSTDAGHMSFGLPSNLKNQKGANKTRKDLYTGLLLGSWAVRCYNDLIQLPQENNRRFLPRFVK